MSKLKIRKGDTVVVISGEHKGSDTYKVVAIDPKAQRAELEGITVKKHSRPSTRHPQGGIIDVPASIHISNLMLVGPDGTPTRVGRRQDEKSGKLVRISKKSEEVIK